jgi:hypothetical protein
MKNKPACIMRTTRRNNRGSALAKLFTYYVSGQISEAEWKQLSRLLDARNTTPEEREALATFYTDLLRDRAPAELRIPRPKEFRDLIALVRPS